LAEIDQQYHNLSGEGWAEPCCGTIRIKSETPIMVDVEIQTKEGMLEDFEDNADNSWLSPADAERKRKEIEAL
jgi:hypothetical protein